MNRLLELRKTLGITQKQMAEAIGIKQAAYSTIELGKTTLTDRNRTTIINIFSVNPVWFDTGIGEMFLNQTKENDILPEALSKSMSVSKDWIESGAGKMFNKEIYQKADVTDRFIITLEHLKIQGIPYSEIATKIGASVSLVSEIRRGKTKLAPHFAKKFIEAFEINEKWLLFGEGDSIFKNITPTEDVTNVHPIIVHDEWIDVPFVPLHARATFAESFLDTNVKEIEIVRIQKRPGINYNKARVFEVDGDSMEPTLVSGEQVLCEVIDPSNWRFTTGVVVVAFGNMVVIKRIKDNDLINGKLVLWSDNEQGGKITLSKDTDEIRRMYKVKYTVYKPIR